MAATSPAISGAATAGMMIFCRMVANLMASAPAATQVAPISPPNSACDELDGRPSSQVTRFQMIAPIRPPKITTGPILASSTRPLAMVLATATEMNAPTRLRTAEMATATLGRRAPVAIEVAIALAVSWKPLVKSNANAVMITTITIVSMDVPPARSVRPGRRR